MITMTDQDIEYERRGQDVALKRHEQGTGPEELHHTCLRCGRHLSNPVSMRQGYGPVCFPKIVRQRRVDEREETENAFRQPELA